MDAAPAGIGDPAAPVIASGMDHTRADIGDPTEALIAGTAARPAGGADLGAIAATRPITDGCPAAAGNRSSGDPDAASPEGGRYGPFYGIRSRRSPVSPRIATARGVSRQDRQIDGLILEGQDRRSQIVGAFTERAAADGRKRSPVTPWQALAALSPEDTKAIVAFLRSCLRRRAPCPARSAPRRPGETESAKDWRRQKSC